MTLLDRPLDSLRTSRPAGKGLAPAVPGGAGASQRFEAIYGRLGRPERQEDAGPQERSATRPERLRDSALLPEPVRDPAQAHERSEQQAAADPRRDASDPSLTAAVAAAAGVGSGAASIRAGDSDADETRDEVSVQRRGGSSSTGAGDRSAEDQPAPPVVDPGTAAGVNIGLQQRPLSFDERGQRRRKSALAQLIDELVDCLQMSEDCLPGDWEILLHLRQDIFTDTRMLMVNRGGRMAVQFMSGDADALERMREGVSEIEERLRPLCSGGLDVVVTAV
jgi:hypothetical protein